MHCDLQLDISLWEAEDAADVQADMHDFNMYLETLEPADRELLRHIESLLDNTSSHLGKQPLKMPGQPPWCLNPQTVLVERYVGGGSFGEVYKGFCKGAPRPVCVKKLNIGRREVDFDDLSGEIESWARLHHPNVMTLRGGCLDTERPFLLSDLCRNGNLSDYLRSHPDTDKIELISHVAQGISFLHRRGIVHGSLTSSNVLITDAGHAAVADWGFVRLRALTSRRSGKPDPRRLVAIPPERLAAAGDEPTQSGDAYAFAMLCYEIWSRKVPFDGVPAYALVYHVVKQGHRPHIDELPLPPALRVLIHRCWHQDPSMRPTFSYIVTELEQIKTSLRAAPSPGLSAHDFARDSNGKRLDSESSSITIADRQTSITLRSDTDSMKKSHAMNDRVHPFYKSIAESQGIFNMKNVPYRGRHLLVEESFELRVEGELSLTAGSMVAPVEVSFDGWVEGLSLETGEYGRFPADCLRLPGATPRKGDTRSVGSSLSARSAPASPHRRSGIWTLGGQSPQRSAAAQSARRGDHPASPRPVSRLSVFERARPTTPSTIASGHHHHMGDRSVSRQSFADRVSISSSVGSGVKVVWGGIKTLFKAKPKDKRGFPASVSRTGSVGSRP
ncbi:kinase-like protein [Gonapodya prolifera JEL478]|uniref:Kinase-like protein n=1 Tax=Gonapodya prolifera (strain JEL478) TaxID=1344416 RepID=A0A139AUQ3_GONPJ|nr:kinase-like protein [Gonapodya prolifera JEL478]|eukprot:KXS20470.1 kinase-like protein [Gonapodya prolifera JEL478]